MRGLLSMFSLFWLMLCLSGCSLIGMVAAPSETIRNMVIDEEGNPVPGVVVTNGWGWGSDSRDEGITDSDGSVELTTTVRGVLGAGASKDGYYPSGGDVFASGYTTLDSAQDGTIRLYRNPIYQMGNLYLVRPPEEITIVLKKITDPVPMYVGRVEGGDLPVLDEKVGFDMEVGDWVSPHGKGRTSDLIFEGKKRYGARNDYEMELVVSFSNPNDGIIRMDVPAPRYLRSQLLSPTKAPLEEYESQLRFERKATPDILPSIKLPPSVYIFRVRAEVDSEGNIIKANYGKIYNGIGYEARETDTIKVYFDHYFNPTINSRSLEYNGKNLFKKPKPPQVRMRGGMPPAPPDDEEEIIFAP